MKSMHIRMTIAATAVALAGSVLLATQDTGKFDVTGKWLAEVETPAGSGSPTFTFKQDGEKLTGHYSGTFGEADLTGSVKGKEITYSLSVEAQGTRLDVTYSGTLESKDSMKGTVKYSALGDGTFTAKRQ